MNEFLALDLSDEIIKALEVKGFTKPMAIQSACIEAALEGRDLLGSAPTGTGKTLAFALPAIQHLLDYPRRRKGPPRVLILTPTRDLALQVSREIESLIKFTHLSVATIIGGISYDEHQEIFDTQKDIVVATPGRLLSYIEQGDFDCRAVEILIFDEADKMLEMGFGEDAKIIAKETASRQAGWLFSATLEGNNLENFAKEVLQDPMLVTADPSRRERKKITQWYYHSDNLEHKIKQLARFVNKFKVQKGLVFVRRREQVRELSDILRKRAIRATHLEGNMTPVQREKALNYLKNGQVNILVATDVAARGIDIEDVDFVIHFDLPYSGDTYVHRTGRTARAGKKGSAIAFVEAHDYPLLAKISRYTKQVLKSRVLEGLEPRTKAPKADDIAKMKSKVKSKTKTKKSQAVKKDNKSAKVKKVRKVDLKNKGKRKNS
ncbi:MAG: ATP-dependent RNA helicase SrmB [Pasteurellales bacterium]|nr:MAG: ATP-dependent RNA helicase SrmB [Pasteurellales bacterium]